MLVTAESPGLGFRAALVPSQDTVSHSRWFLNLVWLLTACSAASARTTPAASPTCAPGDGSWGCQSQPKPANSPPPGVPVSTTYPPASTIPPQGAPAPGAAQIPSPLSEPAGSAVPMTAAANDPINRADVSYLQGRVREITSELIAALDAGSQSRVRQIPIVFDSNPTEVNAFASCTKQGKAVVAVTDGLLSLTAYLAQCEATDEVFGTRTFDAYVAWVAQHQRQGAPLVTPPPNLFSAAQRDDVRKRQRQSELCDEALAFVVGHELAHHYLNHLPCTSVLPLDATEIGLVLTGVVPAFNQPNEGAADVAGIRDVLLAGQRRSGYHWTEGGALMTLRFFKGLDAASPADVFDFERTHPPPSLREPIVRTAAQAFRTAAGLKLPWSG